MYRDRTIQKFLVCMTMMALVALPAMAVAHGQGGGKKLKLEVSDDEKSLVPKTRSECKGHRNRPDYEEDGCMRFEQGKWDTVRIELKRKLCTQGVKSYEWELDAVELAGVNSDEKPEFGGPLDEVAVRDFGAESKNGAIPVDGVPGRAISFNNRNNSIHGYTVWYRVRATCNGESPIYFDPRMDNEGNP